MWQYGDRGGKVHTFLSFFPKTKKNKNKKQKPESSYTQLVMCNTMMIQCMVLQVSEKWRMRYYLFKCH